MHTLAAAVLVLAVAAAPGWGGREPRANLATRKASGWGDDRFVGVEVVHGSRFGDRLTGDRRPNLIDGHGGNDVIAGVPDRLETG